MSSSQSFSSNTVSGKTAYDFSFYNFIEDKPLPLLDFKGKVILVVNTASRCGFTSQYEDLEDLYKTYKDKGFVIIGVPSNDFGSQEPGSNEEITNFCRINFGVTFPITLKERVSGNEAHPFFIWAKAILGFGTAPKWNFHKYLINRQGKLVEYFYSTTSPKSERFIKSIENAINESE